jgi:hypothetical protein
MMVRLVALVLVASRAAKNLSFRAICAEGESKQATITPFSTQPRLSSIDCLVLGFVVTVEVHAALVSEEVSHSCVTTIALDRRLSCRVLQVPYMKDFTSSRTLSSASCGMIETNL